MPIYALTDEGDPNDSLVVKTYFSDLEKLPEGQHLVLGIGVANASLGHGQIIAVIFRVDLWIDNQ